MPLPPATNGPVIEKADGSMEAFDPERLRRSLLRSGAGAHAALNITREVTQTLSPGATSHDVYSRAFALLRKEARPVAARYALRRALLEFGPTGHPFEDFISRLFVAEGWQVGTRQMIAGKCVMHEVDFYAKSKSGDEYIAAELKYHNDPGYKTDLKVALYVKARFEDIFSCDPQAQDCPVDRGMLVTNTKFTSEAVRYAECAGVELLGWSYPLGNDLFERMCRARVYPVTALLALTKSEKRLLVDQGIVAADQIRESRDALRALHIEPERVGEIMAEVDALLAMPHPQGN